MKAWARILGLRVAYGGKTALEVPHLVLQQGGVTALLGPNGSGKSTLIAALSGAAAFEGDVSLLERKVKGMERRELARLVAVVPQVSSRPEGFSLLDVVLMGRFAINPALRESDADRKAAMTALDRVGLSGFGNRRIDQVSGGEAQKALIARALAQDAPVMLWDEPMAHLDVAAQESLGQLAVSLAADGRHILVSSHDVLWVSSFCSQVAALKEGKVCFEGECSQALTPAALQSLFGVEHKKDAAAGSDRIYPVLKA